MSVPEQAFGSSPDFADDPYENPHVLALVDGSGYSFRDAFAKVHGSYPDDEGDQETTSRQVEGDITLDGARRSGGGPVRDFASDRDHNTPTGPYVQEAQAQIAARQARTVLGVAKVWAALDQATALRLGIPVEEASARRVERLERERRRNR